MNDQNTHSFNLHNRKIRNRRNCFKKASNRKWKCQTLLTTSLKISTHTCAQYPRPPHWFSLVGNLVIVLEEVGFSTLILPTDTICEITEITSSKCSGKCTLPSTKQSYSGNFTHLFCKGFCSSFSSAPSSNFSRLLRVFTSFTCVV